MLLRAVASDYSAASSLTVTFSSWPNLVSPQCVQVSLSVDDILEGDELLGGQIASTSHPAMLGPQFQLITIVDANSKSV